MGLDYEKYRPLLDDFNLADEKKDEFIDVMWVLLESFVERAHGTDAAQKFVDKQSDNAGDLGADKVKSSKTTLNSGLNND